MNGQECPYMHAYAKPSLQLLQSDHAAFLNVSVSAREEFLILAVYRFRTRRLGVREDLREATQSNTCSSIC